MTDDVDFAPDLGQVVAAWSGQVERGVRWGARWDARVRGWAQVMFCYDGMIRVEAGEDRWFIPDRFGIWVPPGLAPRVEVADRIEFQIFLVDPRFCGRLGMPDRPTVVRATPLMRGLGRRLRPSEPLTPAERRRLGWVALDEIARLDRPDLHLPGSADPRLARLMAHLLDHPRDAASLPHLAALAGVGTRTLSRLIQSETGMSWRDWRERMRLVLAIEGLQMGRTSTELAVQLGYSGTSAFVAAFRRQSGMTPTEWRRRR